MAKVLIEAKRDLRNTSSDTPQIIKKGTTFEIFVPDDGRLGYNSTNHYKIFTASLSTAGATKELRYFFKLHGLDINDSSRMVNPIFCQSNWNIKVF